MKELPSLMPTPRLPLIDHPHFEAKHVGQKIEGLEPPLPEVFIFSDVLEELCYRAAYAPDQSSVSLLTGGWYVGPFGSYIEVEGFRDSLAIPDPITFLDYVQQHPDLLEPPPSTPMQAPTRLLGCAFARPHSQARMGPDDLIFLNTLFNKPFHTLLLIDATADCFGFFLRDAVGHFHNAPVVVLTATE